MSISWKFILILLIARSKQEWEDREKLYIAQINVLLEQLGGKPKRFTNTQRILLASIAKSLGRQELFEISTLVSPDTLIRWYRKLIEKKWHSSCTATRSQYMEKLPRLL